jgi:hypothetical protein
MCEIWDSQIHDSTSDGLTTDVLAAMNRVTLDIVGLAGGCLSFLTPCHHTLGGLSDWSPDSNAVFVFSHQGFGYNFDALQSREDDLNSAFEAIMKTDNSPAQSTIIPLIGSIAPWIISVVSAHRFWNHQKQILISNRG